MKQTSEKMLISYCGICCSLCPSYEKYCPGCPELEDCRIVCCAKSKNIRYCFRCKDFPCKLFEEGFDWDLDKFPDLKKYKLGVVKWKPYDKEYIRLFKIGREIGKKSKDEKNH